MNKINSYLFPSILLMISVCFGQDFASSTSPGADSKDRVAGNARLAPVANPVKDPAGFEDLVYLSTIARWNIEVRANLPGIISTGWGQPSDGITRFVFERFKPSSDHERTILYRIARDCAHTFRGGDETNSVIHSFIQEGLHKALEQAYHQLPDRQVIPHQQSVADEQDLSPEEGARTSICGCCRRSAPAYKNQRPPAVRLSPPKGKGIYQVMGKIFPVNFNAAHASLLHRLFVQEICLGTIPYFLEDEEGRDQYLEWRKSYRPFADVYYPSNQEERKTKEADPFAQRDLTVSSVLEPILVVLPLVSLVRQYYYPDQPTTLSGLWEGVSSLDPRLWRHMMIIYGQYAVVQDAVNPSENNTVTHANPPNLSNNETLVRSLFAEASREQLDFVMHVDPQTGSETKSLKNNVAGENLQRTLRQLGPEITSLTLTDGDGPCNLIELPSFITPVSITALYINRNSYGSEPDNISTLVQTFPNLKFLKFNTPFVLGEFQQNMNSPLRVLDLSEVDLSLCGVQSRSRRPPQYPWIKRPKRSFGEDPAPSAQQRPKIPPSAQEIFQRVYSSSTAMLQTVLRRDHPAIKDLRQLILSGPFTCKRMIGDLEVFVIGQYK